MLSRPELWRSDNNESPMFKFFIIFFLYYIVTTTQFHAGLRVGITPI